MGRMDNACHIENILEENDSEPGFVSHVYEQIIKKSTSEQQICMAGRMMRAMESDEIISTYVANRFIDNAKILEKMPEKNYQIFEHLLNNFTKDTASFTKEDYQQAFRCVHRNTGNIVLSFPIPAKTEPK